MRRSFAAAVSALMLLVSCSSTPADDRTGAPSEEDGAASVPEVEQAVPPAETDVAAEPTSSAAGASDPAAAPAVAVTTSLPPRDCAPVEPPHLYLWQADPGAASVALSRVVYRCAVEVGLAPADDPQAAAALAARGIEGPLLLASPGFTGALTAELERLAPETLAVSGFIGEEPAALVGSGTADFEVVEIEAGPPESLTLPPEQHRRIWLAAPDAPVASLTAAAAQLGIGLVVAASDLRALPAEVRDSIRRAGQVDMVSDFGEEARWQLEVVRRGHEIPGGGQVMFDGEIDRRLVAFYGHPTTSLLGVLGEQGPEEGIERLKETVVGYEADGAVVLPTFEIIATVASAGAGSDGDYSAATSRDVIRPWVEAAAANDVYVVLDLQPGRTDFLTQAKIYEEFLRLPHVGLALDPEWRLKPNQVHLRQIGTVDAEEINEVVEWLSEIVREEALPQKLLIVHQFRFSMITNRDLIETPPELAVVIQMDGQGSQAAKHNTWDVLTRETEDRGFRWGWKNFYDEDSPIASPAQVLELTPAPVFVSYQ